MNNDGVKKPRNVINRVKFLHLLDSALACKAFRFGRQAALSWLAIYPGDLEVMLLQAEMLAGDEKRAQSIALLDKLVEIDPEYVQAYELQARVAYQKDEDRFAAAISALKVLGTVIPAGFKTLAWADELVIVRRCMEQGELDQAQDMLNQVLGREERSGLCLLDHLRLVSKQNDAQALFQLAELYQAQYPNNLPVLLIMITALMELGNEPEAVKLLHQCVSMDSAGQVARRMWGKDHTYQSIWPEEMAVLFDIPIPAEVAVRMTGAWLPVGEPGSAEETAVAAVSPEVSAPQAIEPIEPVTVSEPAAQAPVVIAEPEKLLDKHALSAIKIELDKIAKHLKRPVIGRSDGRYPAYVIFSSWTGLQAQYGPKTTGVIDLELRRLSDAVKKRTGWDTIVFYPDEEKSTAPLGMQPVDGTDPWKLKLSLADLDKALAKKGEMIGMLLIIGGPQVVPFHELPNPTDDYDEKIQSDNPYATLDSNYFVPEWPVGRLPGETGADAGLLLEQVRVLIANHNRSRRMKSMTEGSVYWPFLVLIQGLIDALTARRQSANIGYSAAVWRRSSTAVFRPVGSPSNILVSPPQESKTIPVERLLKPEIAYYNLHGLEDGAEWYGQRDPSERNQGVDYPVALSPKQLKKNGHAPRVVFSEACYGGNIQNKSGDSALSLKFLSLGTMAVIGSTCIAYGAVATPLVAADLLGNYFWQQMKGGRTAGEALMLAKIDMAREMINRQGFLDAEDQKTLLSFVLYGDPLATLNNQQKRGKNILRLKKHTIVKTIAEKPVEIGEQSPLSFKVLEEVKGKLTSYLPGIESAEIHISMQDGAAMPKKPGSKALENGNCYVVTVSKEVPFAKSIHRHFARATIAADGRVIKLAVSR